LSYRWLKSVELFRSYSTQHFSWKSLFPPQNDGVLGHNSPNKNFCSCDPKRHVLGPNHIFWCITCLGPTFGLGCRVAEKGTRKTVKNRYILRIRGEGPSQPIFTNICTEGLWDNIINCAKFHIDRLRGLGYVGIQILGISVGRRSRH
jgi:hypothetical protein